MIPLLIWAVLAVAGMVIQGRAWRRARNEIALWRAENVDAAAIILRSNERRRFMWRTLICANNLVLAIGIGAGMMLGERGWPVWFGVVYFPASLLANEGVVILLTYLDERARRRAIRSRMSS